MAHEKVFAVCENKCREETYTKKQIDEKFVTDDFKNRILVLTSSAPCRGVSGDYSGNNNYEFHDKFKISDSTSISEVDKYAIISVQSKLVDATGADVGTLGWTTVPVQERDSNSHVTRSIGTNECQINIKRVVTEIIDSENGIFLEARLFVPKQNGSVAPYGEYYKFRIILMKIDDIQTIGSHGNSGEEGEEEEEEILG